MRIFYVLRSHLPNQKAHSVQIFNSSSAMAEAGGEVALVAWHRKVKSGKSAVPGQWPMAADAYFGVAQNFTLVTPRDSQLRRLFRMDRRSRFMIGATRLLAEQMRPGDVVYTRTVDIANRMAKAGIPVVLEMHDHKALEKPPCKELMAKFLPGPGSPLLGIVAISDTLKTLLAEAGIPAGSIAVAHDGIDPSRFVNGLSPQDARLELLEKQFPALEHGPPAAGLAELLATARPVVGYCGHFYEGRGIDMLLECARRRPEWTFLLIGGFEADVEPFREQARREGITNVVFTGYVPNFKLPPFLWACDVLTMPYEKAQSNSHFMSPMKMFEYMACGRAIVTADWPQIREVLTEGHNALFHPRGDVDAMEKSLERAVGDAGLRASLAAQARIDVEAHTWQERGRKIVSWLKERVADRR